MRSKYKINDSLKKYKGYKVTSPKETIKTIEKSFDKIDLKMIYTPRDKQIIIPYSPFQSGSAVLLSKQNDEIELLKSGGKGATPILSRASASAELIERFTGYGLAKGQISHYLSFYKYESLWIKKRRRNKKIERIFPNNFIETDKIISSELERRLSEHTKSICYSLTNDKFYLYPEELISIIEGSNGLASGNTYEEATIHAIMEVIERLVGFYVLDKLPKFKEISRESATHPTLKKLIESVDSIGITFKILDFSHIFDIPVIVTIYNHPDWDLETNPYTNVNCEFPKIVIGVDTDPQDAAMRCFTEIIQSIEPILDAKYDYEYTKNKFLISGLETSEKWKLSLKTTSSAFQNGNQPMTVDLNKYQKTPAKKRISFKDILSIYDVNHKIEIAKVIQNMKNHGIEVFVHNITNPILKFPVVRAMISGGKGYFSNIPFVGYSRLLNKEKNKDKKYSFVNYILKNTYGNQKFYNIIKDGKWCSSEEQTDLINCVIRNMSFTGVKPPLWGKKINKFYFVGMMYLKMGKYEQAKKCFNAALYNNFNDIAPLIGLLHIYRKKGKEEKYKNIRDHINAINRYGMNIEKILEDYNNPVISPNPFELCDLNCKQKNKPELCKNCFFNYVSEDIFMKDFLDDMI